MADERWKRIRAIFDAASEVSGAERDALLARECGDDAALRAEVESLLAHATDPAHSAARDEHGPQRVGTAAIDSDSHKAAPSNGSTAFAPITEGPGSRIGPYKLLQRIGEGGFGAVFMAEQEQPVRRRVALKIIKLGMDTRQVVARFEAERQALAMMDHPHIARVLDGGATESGRPYFVMELVRGDPITQYCDKNTLSIAERLELFDQVCRAVQHAHQKGVIHRDLKPGNVLVGRQDGRAFAKIIDFGIAKATDHRLTEKTLFTELKALIGTPAYMSPEQADGSLDIDTRTDIYALGVLLYELLTGTTPFDPVRLRSAAYGEMQRIIREVEPPRPSTRLSESVDTLSSVAAQRRSEPRKLGLLVRGDLDWIVMKALEKDRARRYESADAFAADVQRHLMGEPVVAAPPSVAYRARKFVRKHRGQVAVGAVLAATLLITSTVLTVALKKTSYALLDAKNERAKAEALNERLNDVADEAKGALAVLVDSFEKAESSKPARIPTDAELRARSSEVSIHRDPAKGDFKRQSPITDMLTIGLAQQTEIIKQRDTAEWEAYSANIALTQAATANHNWPEARQRLKKCPESKRGWEWRYIDQWVRSIDSDFKDVTDVQLSPDGTRIVILSPVGPARLLDWSGRLIRESMIDATCAQFSSDGKYIVLSKSAYSESDITPTYLPTCLFFQVWDAATGMPAGELVRPKTKDSIFVGFSHDGAMVLMSTKYAVFCCDARTGKQIGTSMRRERLSAINPIFSPDDRFVLTCPEYSTVQLWNTANGSPHGVPLRHDDTVNAALFSPDGRLVLTSSDNEVLLWDVSSGEPHGEPMEHEERVNSAIISLDGKLLLTRSESTAWLWDVASGELHGEPLRHDFPIQTAIFSPDGGFVLTVSGCMAQRWDGGTGKPSGEPMRHDGLVNSANFSRDGKRIVTTSEDGTVRLWDDSGRSMGVRDMMGWLETPQTTGSFSPDGRSVLVSNFGYANGGAAGYSDFGWATFISLDRFDPPNVFVPTDLDPQLEIAAIMDYTIRSQGRNLSAKTSDGSRVATVYADRTLRFTEPLHQREVATFSLPCNAIDVKFSPDDTRLGMLLSDGSALIWDTRNEAARQADRDARAAEFKFAEAYVGELWANPKPIEQLADAIRSDNSVSPLRRLAALQMLKERIAGNDAKVKEELFNTLRQLTTDRTIDQLSAGQVHRAIAARKDLPPRLYAALQKKAADWKPDPLTLNLAAREIVEAPGQPPDQIQLALEAAQEAIASKPDDPEIMLTLGAAQYRIGQFKDALNSLSQVRSLHNEAQPEDSALIAMVQFKLGRLDEARDSLRQLRKLMKQRDNMLNDTAQACFQEATALIEGRTTTAPSTQPTSAPASRSIETPSSPATLPAVKER